MVMARTFQKDTSSIIECGYRCCDIVPVLILTGLCSIHSRALHCVANSLSPGISGIYGTTKRPGTTTRASTFRPTNDYTHPLSIEAWEPILRLVTAAVYTTRAWGSSSCILFSSGMDLLVFRIANSDIPESTCPFCLYIWAIGVTTTGVRGDDSYDMQMVRRFAVYWGLNIYVMS